MVVWTRNNTLPQLAWLALLLVASGPAGATILTVGGDTNCDHGAVQDAINALSAAGSHEIRIQQGDYAAQAINITSRSVILHGGYASCSNTSLSGTTTLSGEGGGSDSVLTITGTGNDVILQHILLTKGDEVDDGDGGGIDFRGAGTLTLRDTVVSNSYAGYGGGISVSATGGYAELRIEEASHILLNTAQFSGGGIRVEGDARVFMLDDGSSIFYNNAIGIDPSNNQPLYGYGGGIEVIGPAHADLSGLISNNTARYGGGIAVVAGEDDGGLSASVRLFTTDATNPVEVSDNVASVAGGAAWIRPYAEGVFEDLNWATFCANNFRIDGNSAPQASAIYADTDDAVSGSELGGQIVLNDHDNYWCSPEPVATWDSVACAADVECNTINDNVNEDINGSGATILVLTDGYFEAHRTTFRGNEAEQVLLLSGTDSSAYCRNCLFADNTVSGSLIRAEDDAVQLELVDTTIAGNSIGAPEVLVLDVDEFSGIDVAGFEMYRSILWQPGKTALRQPYGDRIVKYVVTNDRDSLDGGNTPYVTEADPRFEDPGHGDYRPIAASPAVDYTPAITGTDIEGKPRDVDIFGYVSGFGPNDAGAYERQDTFSMVRNHSFSSDLRLWAPIVAGVATWNPQGYASAGSVDISTEPAQPGNSRDLYAMTQCVHIPGPGDYALNGFGYGASNGNPIFFPRDSVRLHWIIRYAPIGESCFSQPADAEGDLLILAGDTWGAPAEPAILHVPADAWTSTTAVEILLVVHESGSNVVGQPSDTTGHFDGITLEPVASDLIFANGFD